MLRFLSSFFDLLAAGQCIIYMNHTWWCSLVFSFRFRLGDIAWFSLCTFFTNSTVQFIRSYHAHKLIENGIIPSLCEKLSRFIGKYQSVHPDGPQTWAEAVTALFWCWSRQRCVWVMQKSFLQCPMWKRSSPRNENCWAYCRICGIAKPKSYMIFDGNKSVKLLLNFLQKYRSLTWHSNDFGT